MAAFLKRDLARGEELFRASLSHDESRWDCHYFFGRLLAQQQKWHEAVASYERAHERNPSQPAVLLELGQVQASMPGQFEAAAATLLRAAALDVHNPQPLLVLAQSALAGGRGALAGGQLGRVAVALRAYEDACELHPWSAQPMLQLASLRATLEGGDAHEAALAAAAASRPGAPTICELREAAISLNPAASVR